MSFNNLLGRVALPCPAARACLRWARVVEPPVMDAPGSGYMFWAKTHRRARFELTASGLSTAALEDFDGQSASLELEPAGPYGEPDLIEGIARLRGVEPDTVLPVPGASTANFIALACAANRGERVLIESPAYDPLPRAARFLGLRPVFFERQPGQRYAPDLDAVERGLRNDARAVLLTNLHNPSGLVCPDALLRQLAQLTGKHGAQLIVDEVYLDYARLNSGSNPLRAAGLGEHVITTDSLTKVYGLGPLRAGWLIAHPRVLERARQVLDLLNVVNPVASARLTRHALDRLDRLAQRCRQAHATCYPTVSSWLATRDDLVDCGHDGALFAWLRLTESVRASHLADLLAVEYDTNLVPGTLFGSDDHVRIGFDLAPQDLTAGLERVGIALDRLRFARGRSGGGRP